VQWTLDALVRQVDGVAGATSRPLGRVARRRPADASRCSPNLSGREWYQGVTRTHRPYVSRTFHSVAIGNRGHRRRRAAAARPAAAHWAS